MIEDHQVLTPTFQDSLSRSLSKLQGRPPLWKIIRPSAVAFPEYSHPVVLSSGVWISQEFGMNPQSYSPMKGHDGIDYAIMTGGDCMCTSAWQKVLKLLLYTYGYGRHAWTIDEAGHTHIYGHLSEFLCDVGQEVTRGQIFAKTGGGKEDPYRGYSSGPHIHWELRPQGTSISNGYGGAVDQKPYITYKGSVTPTPIPLPEPLYYLVANTRLRIRKSPKGGTWTNLTGEYVEKGQRIPVYKTSIEGRFWAQINQGSRFVCIEENGTTYLEAVQEE